MYIDFYRFSEVSIVKRSEMLKQYVEILYENLALRQCFLIFVSKVLKVATLRNMLLHVFIL